MANPKYVCICVNDLKTGEQCGKVLTDLRLPPGGAFKGRKDILNGTCPEHGETAIHLDKNGKQER